MQLKLVEQLQKLEEGAARARKMYVDRGIITEDVFTQLLGKDPSPNGKYIEWICKVWGEDTGEATVNDFKVVAEFDKLVNKGIIKDSAKDIGRYSGLMDLNALVDSHSGKTSARQGREAIKVAGAQVVLDNDKCTVYYVNGGEGTMAQREIAGEKAAILLGKNTKWCISATKAENQYKKYFNEHKAVYIILPKGVLATKMGKIAVIIHRSGATEVWDAPNNNDTYTINDVRKAFNIPL